MTSLLPTKPIGPHIRSVCVTCADLHAFLYVSDSRLRTTDAFSELQAIVKVSVGNNAASGISGALMFTEENFIQFLEGPANALDGLLRTLRADRRHENLRLLVDRPIKERLFGPWALAYYGPHDFVRAEVDAAMQNGGETDHRRLIDMMAGFVAAGKPSSI